MQDHAEEVDGCGSNGLRGEEVVSLGRDAGADGGGLRGEDGDAVGDCVGEVLDDELELGERGREGDGGAARGAADLRIGVSPLASATKFFETFGHSLWLLLMGGRNAYIDHERSFLCLCPIVACQQMPQTCPGAGLDTPHIGRELT